MKDIIGDLKKTGKVAAETVQQFDKLAKAMIGFSQAMSTSINQAGSFKAELNKLNKEKQEAYITNKRLMQSETLVGAIYTKNSAVAQKRYLTSLTGLRQAMFRFREESGRVLVMEKGHLSMLNDQTNAMKRFYIQGNLVSRTLDNMSTKYLNLGKNLQWTGRQLMVGVTLPLAAIGTTAVKSYMEWDRAITRTTKLLEDQVDAQGRVVKTAKDVSKELQAAATDLSQNKFGISRSEIMNQMGLFAQIGLRTKDEIEKLANLSLEFNILGDLDDTAKAAEMTRVIFQGFNAELRGNTQAAINETAKTLKVFNLIEDETSLSMEGIADAIPKVANSARQLGMTLPETSAFLSAMTQNGIEATEAANALRFALVKMPAAGAYMEDPALMGEGKLRLKELTTMVEKYNEVAAEGKKIDIFGADGRFKGAKEMLLQLAQAWGSMGDGLQIAFTRALTGTTQAERLGTLLNNVNSAMSGNQAEDFFKAINLADDVDLANQKWVKQLEDVLGSDAYEWARIVEGFKNTVQDLGKELSTVLIPIAKQVAGWLREGVSWFQQLDDGTKKWIVSLGIFATIIGPITYGMGQLVILAMQLVKASFTKPLKAFFHMGSVLKGFGDETGEIQKKVAKLFADFEGRKIDSSQLISGIEDTMRKEIALRGEVEKTTAALRAQGMVDATPNVMGAAGGAAGGQVARGRLRDTLSRAWKKGIAGTGLGGIVAPTSGPQVGRQTYSLAELEQMFPEAVEQATKKVINAQLTGKMSGSGFGAVTDEMVLKSLGDRITRKDVPHRAYTAAKDKVDNLVDNLSKRDELIADLSSDAFREVMDESVRQMQQTPTWRGATAKELRLYRKQFEKIGQFLAERTNISVSQMMTPDFMDPLMRDIISLADISPGTGLPSLSKASLTNAVLKVAESGFWPNDPNELVRMLGVTQKSLTDLAHATVRNINDGLKFMIGDAAMSINEVLGADMFTSGIQGGYSNLVQDELDAVVRRDHPNKSESDIAKERASRVRSKFSTETKTGHENARNFASEVAQRYGVSVEKDFAAFRSFFNDDFSEIVIPASDALSRGLVDQKTLNLIGKDIFAGLASIETELEGMYGQAMTNILRPRKASGGRKELRKHFGELFDSRSDESAIRDLHTQGRIDDAELASRLAARAKDRETFIKNELWAIWNEEKQASKRARTSINAFITDLEKTVLTERMREMGASQKQIDAFLKRFFELRRMDEWTKVRGSIPGSDAARVGQTLMADETMQSALDYQLKDLDSKIAELDRQARVIRSKSNRLKKGKITGINATIRKLKKERAEIYAALQQARMELVSVESHYPVERDVPHVDGSRIDSGNGSQIMAEERARLERERELGNRRIEQIANRRVQQTMQRMADAGVMQDFEDNVRTPLARQIMDPKRRRGEFLKAAFSGGFFGSFNGQMSDEEIRARAALMQDDPDRKIRGRDVRRQIRSDRIFEATGGAGDAQLMLPGMGPDPDGPDGPRKRPVIDRDAPGRFQKIKGSMKGLPEATKKWGSSLKEVSIKGAALSAGQGVLNVATWAQPKNAIDKTGGALTKMMAAAKHMDEMPGTMGRVGTAGKGLFQSFDMLSGGMLSVSGGAITSLGALGPLIPIMLAIAAVVLLVWKNWDKVKEGIGGGLKALGNAFGSIKSAVLDPFQDVFESLNSNGDSMGNMWKNVGKIINVAAHAIAKGLELIAHPIRFIMERIAGLMGILINIAQFIVAFATGDWKGAWEAMRDIVGGILSTIVGGLAEIPAALIDTLGVIVDGIQALVDRIPRSVFGVDIPGVKAARNAVSDLSDGIHGFADEIRDFPDTLGDKIAGNKKGSKKAADDEIKEYQYNWKKSETETPGVIANTDAAEDAADEEKKKYVESFVSAFQGRMRDIVDGWKEAALKAYDEWVEKQEESVDAQIEGINDLTKAEEEALKKREYARRRAEMLNDMRFRKNQYILNREKLIYEGKYDEAAELDMQYAIDKNNADQELRDYDEQHNRELVLAAREAQIEMLEDQKEHNRKIYDLNREALQKQLDAITEYIPQNSAEAARMQEQILAAMRPYLGQYGDMAITAQENWRQGWSTAWVQTSKQVTKDSFWTGKEALKQFARGLGVDPSIFDDVGGGDFGGTAPPSSDPRNTPSDMGKMGGGTYVAPKPNTGIVGGGGVYGMPKHHTGGSIGNTSMAPQDVPATLQTGEYVVQRKAVAKYGTSFLNAINEGAAVFHAGGLVANKAMNRAKDIAFAKFFSGETSLGGMTWGHVKNAYMNSIGGGGGSWMSAGDVSGMTIAQIVDNVVKGIHPEFKKRLDMWNNEMGGRFDTSRGYRSMAQQEYLWNRWRNRVPGQAPAAPPGRSMHNFGLAVDLIPSITSAAQRAAGAKYGLRWPMSYEPWHVEPIEARQWRDMILQGKVPMGGAPLDQGIVKLMPGLFGNTALPTTSGGDAKSKVRSMMAQYGWGADQWPALERLVQKESSWNPGAANPTSSARGLFQFLKSTWGSYITNRGGPPYWVQDVGIQAKGGLSYIKERYGSPGAALDFHNRHNWYHGGGYVVNVPKFHTGNYQVKQTGLAEVAKGERIKYADQEGGTELHFHFEGGFFGTDKEIRKLGKEIERVMATQKRAQGMEPRSFRRA